MINKLKEVYCNNLLNVISNQNQFIDIKVFKIMSL